MMFLIKCLMMLMMTMMTTMKLGGKGKGKEKHGCVIFDYIVCYVFFVFVIRVVRF